MSTLRSRTGFGVYAPLQMCRYGVLDGARRATFCARVRCANVELSEVPVGLTPSQLSAALDRRATRMRQAGDTDVVSWLEDRVPGGCGSVEARHGRDGADPGRHRLRG